MVAIVIVDDVAASIMFTFENIMFTIRTGMKKQIGASSIRTRYTKCQVPGV